MVTEKCRFKFINDILIRHYYVQLSMKGWESMSVQGQLIEQKEEYFELLPGKLLDIQINFPVTVRKKLTLVGYELGKYLVLKWPKSANKNDYNDVLVEGNGMIIRYLLEGNSGKCYAFRTSITSIIQYPERLIFVGYPETLENRELRNQKRKETHIPASISMGVEGENTKVNKISGIINDVNIKGCGFSFKASNDKVKVNNRDITVWFNSLNNEVKKVSAKVCNSRNDKGLVSVGIQFCDDEKVIVSTLESLQLEGYI